MPKKLIQAIILLFVCMSANGQGLSSKYDSKNHPKAKGVWVSIRYPAGWQAKEGERPHIVQKFVGDYKGMFTMLALQIVDTGGPVEKECRETNAKDFGKDMVESESSLKLLDIKKIKHEEKPGYIYDLQTFVERAGISATTTHRAMSICYKNVLVSAWCSPLIINKANQTVSSNQQDLDRVKDLCFQFFNSLVLMDKY